MTAEQSNMWDRLHQLGHLALIGCMILTAGFAVGTEDLSAWQKQLPITFSGYTPPGGGETLTNFPVLVVLSNTVAGSGFSYNDFLSPPYGDLRFAVADKEAQLDFEVASWDTNGLSHVWVRVPELTADTTICALWGKSGVDAPLCTTNGSVWSAGFTGVWHLEETNGVTARDAIGNRYPGTMSGAKASMGATGQVGRAYRFGGNTGYVATGLTNGTTVTVSAWGSLTSAGDRMLWNRAKYSPDLYFTSGNICLNTGDGAGNSFCAQPDDVEQLHHYVTVIDASHPNASLYIDGRLASTNANYKNPAGTPFQISSGYTYDWHGIIDEFTVADVARSPNWIWANYMTMASNDVFAVHGDPGNQDLPWVGSSGWATNVTASSAWLNGTLSSTGISATAVFVYWGLTDGGTNASFWANTNIWAASQVAGDFTIQATDLSANSTYYYRLAASNAAGWAWMPQASVFITGEVWIENTSDASETGPTPGTFTVHRASAVTNEALLVTYTVSGTATPDVDYVALSGTVTIPVGETNTAIEVMPIFDHFLEGTETVVVTVVPGPYLIGTVSNATINIADAGMVMLTWGGGGANALASNPGNWVGGVLPVAGDGVILDTTTNKNMTWDLDVTLGAWYQVGYTGTVTVATRYGSTGFTNLVILGNCVISNGVWTQIANPNVSYEVNRLSAMIGGNLTVGADAQLDVTALGYAKGQGPGTGSGQRGGSHGGMGGVATGVSGPCYGSVTAPTSLGSGGASSAGGGAILLKVTGEFRHDGLLCADGSGVGYPGAGGSVYLTAGTLTGTGTVQANGGVYANPGGGGRVALVVTNAGADFADFNGFVSAFAGGTKGSAGTIYRETPADSPGKGELIVDNVGGTATPGYYTYLGDAQPTTCEFSRIVLTNGGVLGIGPNDTLIATNTLWTGSAANATEGVAIQGGTLFVPDAFTLTNFFIRIGASGSTFSPATSFTVGTNAEFRVEQPHVMATHLIIDSGGNLTHTANAGSEAYKMDLTVNGSMLVNEGGLVDVTGRGYAAARGPGHPLSGNGGGSHGGIGAPLVTAVSGPCYGSVTAPTTLGSGGSSASGGGAIQLTVTGTLTNNGLITADGQTANHYVGAGGSVWITVGRLAGNGTIQANGGRTLGTVTPGGGGRVAVTVTNLGESVELYAGTISAYGGARNPGYAPQAGAGTVYLRTAEMAQEEGTLIVDNADSPNACLTVFDSNVTDKSVGNVLIRAGGSLLLATNQTLVLSGIWSNAASFEGQAESMVIFAGETGSTSVVYGATTFMGLICTNAGKTLQLEAGMTNRVDAAGRFWIKGTEAEPVMLRSTSPGTAWKLTVDSTADQAVKFVDVQDSDAGDGAEITALNSVDSLRNSNWRFEGIVPGITNTWTGGTSTVWSARENWELDRAPVESDALVIPGGMPRYPVLDANRSVNRLTIQSGASLALDGRNLTVTNILLVAGTLTASGTETITLLKDSDFTGGMFNSARSTVILTGNGAQSNNLGGAAFFNIRMENSADTVTLSGGFTATELRCEAPSGPRSLRFEPGKTVALRDFVMRGASPGATNITLQSTTADQKWELAVSGYRSVYGVGVQDSDASGGLPIPALDSENGGGNVNWTFGVAPALWLGTSSANFHTAANWNPADVPDAATRVVVAGVNPMTLTGSVSILDLTVGGGTETTSVTVNGLLIVSEGITVLNNGTLSLNKPAVVSNDFSVLAGGTLTHAANGSTEANKTDLTVFGDLGVDVGGVVNVAGKGYARRNGPASGTGHSGASYGGCGGVADYGTNGPCYGSIMAPTNLGSGGDSEVGGGAIIARVSGEIRNDGLFCANGFSAAYAGSGGSIFLTGGALTGFGTIQANGGVGLSGGGRVALVVTNTLADFSGFTGAISAFSGSTKSGAGTIYKQCAADRPGRGSVWVDNNSSASYTAVPPDSPGNVPGEAYRSTFFVANKARLLLTNDFTVGDIWLDTADAWLDLGSNTLTVNAREHPLGLVENVLNRGAIVWTGLPPGVLIIVK